MYFTFVKYLYLFNLILDAKILLMQSTDPNFLNSKKGYLK